MERLEQNRLRMLIERETWDLKRKGTSPTDAQGPTLSNPVLFDLISQMSKLGVPITEPSLYSASVIKTLELGTAKC